MTTDAPMFSTEEILWYDNGRWGEAGYAIANPNGKTWTNNGVLIKFVDPADYAPNQPRGFDVGCPAVGHFSMGAFVAELWRDGSKVDEVGPYRACAGTESFRVKICLGEGVIRVSDGYRDVVLFRYAMSATDSFGDNPYWGVGVTGLPAGVTAIVASMSLAHTSDQNNGYPPSSGPTNCEPCFTPYIIGGSVCSESYSLPTMLKVAISGIENSPGSPDCDCPDLDGIYFLMPRYIFTRYGSGQAFYGLLLEANDASSCINSIYALSATMGPSFLSVAFSGDPFDPVFAGGPHFNYDDFSNPPYVCLDDLTDLELTPGGAINLSCVIGTGAYCKVTTIR